MRLACIERRIGDADVVLVSKSDVRVVVELGADDVLILRESDVLAKVVGDRAAV